MSSKRIHPSLKIVSLLGSSFANVNNLLADAATPDNQKVMLLAVKKDLEEIQGIAHKLNNKSFV